jgi:hypothetical protein
MSQGNCSAYGSTRNLDLRRCGLHLRQALDQENVRLTPSEPVGTPDGIACRYAIDSTIWWSPSLQADVRPALQLGRAHCRWATEYHLPRQNIPGWKINGDEIKNGRRQSAHHTAAAPAVA